MYAEGESGFISDSTEDINRATSCVSNSTSHSRDSNALDGSSLLPAIRDYASGTFVVAEQCSSARYLNELVKDMRMLDSIQAQYPGKFRQAQTLLTKEIDRVWSDIYLHAVQDYQVQPVDSQNTITGSVTTIQKKIMIPHQPECKLIGRILGPRGMSVRQLEAQSDCQILIRGKGSIKDPRREARLRHRFGWEHLTEPLHVLVTATDISRERCTQKLANGVQKIKTLLKSNNDEYKRLQLVQLAIINGTYRPMRAQK